MITSSKADFEYPLDLPINHFRNKKSRKKGYMGKFLNPDNSTFQVALNSKIYVDKTGLLAETNGVIDTKQREEYKYPCYQCPEKSCNQC